MWEMYTFFYLGLPIGGDLRRLGFWEPAVTRILKRLSRWKSCFLSFGGCFILLKSVLTCLRSFFWEGGVRILVKFLGLVGKQYVFIMSMEGWRFDS
jgi:hypothetical protein